MKFNFKIGLFIVAAFGFLIILLLWPYKMLLFPDSYFSNERTIDKFTVHSDQPIHDSLTVILDRVKFRLTDVPEFVESEYEIYLCYDPKLFGSFAEKVGKPETVQGFNLHPLDRVFVNLQMVECINKRHGDQYPYGILSGSLDQVITHEIVHQIIEVRIGFKTMKKIPSWKQEGYCEYFSDQKLKQADSNYSFRNRVDNYFSKEGELLSPERKEYLKAALLAEYCLDQLGMSSLDFLEDSINQEMLMEEIESKFYEQH